MTNLDHHWPRRAVIKGAGLGLVAGGLATTLPAQPASAQASAAGELHNMRA